MGYHAEITSRDLARLYEEIDVEHSEAAQERYAGLKEAILSLEERPKRCPVTPGGGSNFGR